MVVRRHLLTGFMAAELDPHLDGRVGLFSPGLVAMGRDDIEQLAKRVWATYVTPLAAYEARLQEALAPGTVFSFEDVRDAVVEYIVSHEVGHAHQESERKVLSPGQKEDDADVFAGVVAAAEGWNLLLHRMVARTIGCTGALCVHGSPDRRERMFQRGVEARRLQTTSRTG